jgi:PAS domain S-box-containing protein
MGVLGGTGSLVLAVASQKDHLRVAQVAAARSEASAPGPRRSPEGLLHGQPASAYEFRLNTNLREQLAHAVGQLTAVWHTQTARTIQSDAVRVDAAVAHLMSLIAQHRIAAAQAFSTRTVEPLGNALDADLARAEVELTNETRAVDSRILQGTIVIVAAAVLLLVGVLFLAARGRRRNDREETEGRMIKDSEQRLQVLLQNSSDMITVVSPDTVVIYQAGSVESVLGHNASQLEGTALTSWVDPADMDALIAVCSAPDGGSTELRLRHRDGGLRMCEVRATALPEDSIWSGVVLNIRDVGERKSLELELRLAQRLEAIGQLAAGIAHEINTPIQFVSDTTGFLKSAYTELIELVEADGELREAAATGTISPAVLQRVQAAADAADLGYLQERIPLAFERITEGIERVTKIVAAMRTFALPRTLERAPVDLNEAIRNTLTVAASEYKRVAALTTDLGELPATVCNLGEINQVLLNLIVNAGHAITDAVGKSGPTGSLHICSAVQGDGVLISITDSGGGIADEDADRVFDPFFTTKEVGKGTGQGLAIARRLVVEGHGGSLTFESRPGEGTTFFVFLPTGSIDENVALAA